MKAIVTIVDDDGYVLYKDKIIQPIEQRIERKQHLKRARFHFEVTRALYNMVCKLGTDEEGGE